MHGPDPVARLEVQLVAVKGTRQGSKHGKKAVNSTAFFYVSDDYR
jgi:hypothetical protein